jgi:hypothetical protein
MSAYLLVPLVIIASVTALFVVALVRAEKKDIPELVRRLVQLIQRLPPGGSPPALPG